MSCMSLAVLVSRDSIQAKTAGLHVMAGQSNMQRYRGNAGFYPTRENSVLTVILGVDKQHP